MTKKLILLLAIFPTLTFAANWECINRSVLECNTWKLSVPQGWIVASDNPAGNGGYAITYVPDLMHVWR